MRFRTPNLRLPLLAKELAEMAQRRRTYGVRAAFAVLMFSTSGLLFLPTYLALVRGPYGLLGQGAQLLNVLYTVEWAGLSLFVPAIVSGAIAAEKERSTLQLLFLTRLGPWTILLEKLLSRFVPVATFLLISLPLLFVAYLMGGLTRHDLGWAALGMATTTLEVAGIALFSSAFCATSASAFVLSYVLLALVYLFPFLVALLVALIESCFSIVAGHPSAFVNWIDQPQMQPVIQRLFTSTQGINLDWLFGPRVTGRTGGGHPFHTTYFTPIVISCIGFGFLLLARRVIVRRASPQPKHRLRRLFQWLDRAFHRLNERYAKGIVLTRSASDLPDERPVAWREKRRGNLGRVNHLIRILLAVEAPILTLTVLFAATMTRGDFGPLHALNMLLWPIAILIVIVRACGLIAAEKARQTLDVLLVAPLSLAALAGEKMRGLRRVMLIVAVPILFHACFLGYLLSSAGSHRLNYARTPVPGREIESVDSRVYVAIVVVNLVIVLGLVAQLAFRFGLQAKTQGRAVSASLGLFVAWCFLPILVDACTDLGSMTLYFTPIAGVLVNEDPTIAEDPTTVMAHRSIGRPPFYVSQRTVSTTFHMLPFFVLYGMIVVALALSNRRLAARMLLRPLSETVHPGKRLVGRSYARRPSEREVALAHRFDAGDFAGPPA